MTPQPREPQLNIRAIAKILIAEPDYFANLLLAICEGLEGPHFEAAPAILNEGDFLKLCLRLMRCHKPWLEQVGPHLDRRTYVFIWELHKVMARHDLKLMDQLNAEATVDEGAVAAESIAHSPRALANFLNKLVAKSPALAQGQDDDSVINQWLGTIADDMSMHAKGVICLFAAQCLERMSNADLEKSLGGRS